MFKNTSPGRGHSALSAESRRLSMSETDGGPESLESRRLHASEMPTMSLGSRREVRENVRELFRSKVRMFESMSQNAAAGNAKLKPDVSARQLELKDGKNDEQILRKRVEILTAEGVQLKGLHETNQTEIKQLKDAVCVLKESEDSLKQQHVSIANELSQYESLTERQNQQNRNLKAAVQDLQSLLDEAEQQIFDKDELIKKRDREIEFNQQLVEELNTKRIDMNQSICDLKQQLEARQEEEILAGVEDFSQQCSFLVEKYDILTAERDQLLSLREEQHTEVEQLREALQSLQTRERFLNEDVHSLTAEGVRLKSLHETNQTEIKQLKAAVGALKESEDSLKQQHVSIANELSQYESLTERQNQQNRNLKAAVQDLQCRLNAAEQQVSDKDGCRTRQEDKVSAGVENFSPQCSFLVEKCDNLTPERGQLLSLREEHHTEVEQLKAAVRALKESEDSLQQQLVSITNELSQYESLTDRQNQQNKSLKMAVQDLQCQLKEAEQQVSDKDGSRTRQEEEVLAGVEDFSQQCSVWAEKCDNLTAERDQLLSLREEHHTEAEQLREALHSLQTKESFMNEDIHNLTAQGVRYESLIQKNQAEIQQLKKTAQTETQNHLAAVQQLESLMDKKQREIERLRVGLQSLQDREHILNEQVENLTAEEVRYERLIQKHQEQIQQLKRTAQTETENHFAAVEQLESLIDEKQRENERLRAALQSLQNKERFLNEDVNSLTAEGVQLKQLNETNQAEIKQLKATVRALKESEDSLKQQHVSITNKLSQHESLTERQNQQNRNLKTAVKDLQSLLNEAEQQIFDKDELIKKRDREIEFSQQLVEELNTKSIDLNQSICALKDQLEARQEEEILAGVENFRQHSSLLAEKCDNLTTERDQLLSLRKEHHTEAEQLRVLIETRDREIENNQQLVEELNTKSIDLNQSICALKDQLEARQEEEILAGVENFRQHSSFLAEKCDNLTAERDQLLSLRKEHHTEVEQLRVLIETRYREIENNQQLVEELNTERSDLNQSICDLEYQRETRQEEEVLANSPEPGSPEKLRDDNLLESPPAETRADKVQIGSFWRRFARRLLVLSVCVGLTSASALVSGSFMAYNMFLDGQNTYCHLEPGVPCPI